MKIMSKSKIIDQYSASYIMREKEILSQINNEKLYFSDKIIKVNHYGMSQERAIILTDKALYNMKKKTLRRKILYNDIKGITYSKLTYEFVIHGNENEYDYEYVSPERDFIICLIAIFYQNSMFKSLKICEVQEKTLKNFVTGKKDKKKDNSNSKMDEKFLIDTTDYINQHMKEILPSDPSSSGKQKIDTIFSNHKTIKTVSLEDFKF